MMNKVIVAVGFFVIGLAVALTLGHYISVGAAALGLVFYAIGGAVWVASRRSTIGRDNL